LNSVPSFEKAYYIKKEHYSNFCTFEIASLVNVLGHYLRKYGRHCAHDCWQHMSKTYHQSKDRAVCQ
jgi:hypothetical protein